MSEPIDQIFARVELLKSRATSLRNRKRYEQALAAFAEAVQYLEDYLGRVEARGAASGAELSKLRNELADTLGMIGGVYRRQDDLKKALESYERGLKYESTDRVSTYNLGNTIALSIIVAGNDPQNEPLVSRIKRVKEDLEAQTSGSGAARIDEWWAWADLGQLYLLSGQPGEARRSFAAGLSTNPPRGEVERTILLLRQLAGGLPQSAAKIAESMNQQARLLTE